MGSGNDRMDGRHPNVVKSDMIKVLVGLEVKIGCSTRERSISTPSNLELDKTMEGNAMRSVVVTY